MDLVSGSDVPGLEGHSARRGTANAEAIGAARHWFKEAEKRREELKHRRAWSFIAGMWATALVDVAIRWLL